MSNRKRARLDLNEESDPEQSGDCDVRNCLNDNCTNLKELADSYTAILNVHRRMLLTAPTSDGDSVLTRQNIDVGILKMLWTKRCPRACGRGRLKAFVHACATYPSPETFHQVITVLKEDETLEDLMKERGVDGATPLHISVHHMEVKKETVETLMEMVGINDVDDKGDNVLSHAVQGGRDEAYLKLLQGLGAEPGISNDGSSLALQAVKVGNVDAIKLFAKMEDLCPQTAESSWLHKVICQYAGSLSRQDIHETVKALLNINKALVLLHDKEGRAPLWFAKNGPFKDKISACTVDLLLDYSEKEQIKLIRVVPEPEPAASLGTRLTPPETEIVSRQLSDGDGEQSDVSSEGEATQEREEAECDQDPEPAEPSNQIHSRCYRKLASPSTPSRSEDETTQERDKEECDQEPEPRNQIHSRCHRKSARHSQRSPSTPSRSEDETTQERGTEEPGPSNQINSRCYRKSARQSQPSSSSTHSRGSDKEKCLSDFEKINQIHMIISGTVQCSREEILEKKNELRKILGPNAELLKDDGEVLFLDDVHVDLLEFLIEEGADVSATTKTKGETVLHTAATYLDAKAYDQLVQAVKNKNPSVLKRLTTERRLAVQDAAWCMELKQTTLDSFKECGANMDSCDIWGLNMFGYALAGGRSLAFLKSLRKLGVKPRKDNKDVTLVHQAAQKSSLEIMKFMIKLSPEDVLAVDRDNLTPLHYAITELNANEESVKKTLTLLHDFKVKDHLKEDHMRNLLHVAVSKSYKANQEEIERKKEILGELIKCDSSLLGATWDLNEIPLECDGVHLDLIKYLLKKGSNPRHRWGANHENYVFMHGMSHLTPGEYQNLIQFLVKKGIEDVLTMRHKAGRTPIHEAVNLVELKMETIKLFERIGDLNDEDDDGWNTLMYAVDGGRSLKFIQMLEGEGVQVRPAKDGTTVVHIAAGKGRKEVFEYFLKKSRNPVQVARKKNGWEETPLHFAVKGVNGDGIRGGIVKDLLVKYGLKTVVPSLGNVLQVCVKYTKNKGRKEIRERLEILKLLFECDPSLKNGIRSVPVKELIVAQIHLALHRALMS